MYEEGELPTIMTVRELATYLRAHELTIYRMATQGEIPAYKVGKRWRFNRHRIEKWRDAHQVCGATIRPQLPWAISPPPTARRRCPWN